MSVGTEPAARRDSIVINDSQRSKSHTIGVLKMPKGKGVPAIESAEVRMATKMTLVKGAYGGGSHEIT